MVRCSHRPFKASNVEGAAIAGLGLTGRIHGAVCLDVDDQVIRPMLIWNDQRIAAKCAESTERVGNTKCQINLVFVTCNAQYGT